MLPTIFDREFTETFIGCADEVTDTGSAHVGELSTRSSAGADEFIGFAGLAWCRHPANVLSKA